MGVAVAGLPWVEITAGLCLAVGLKPRSCLLLLAGLVAGFLVVILITMARGLKNRLRLRPVFSKAGGAGRGAGRCGSCWLGRGALLVGAHRWWAAPTSYHLVEPRKTKTENRLSMARFFNFYDPLEKRYVFNSFLVVVGLVEILILVFTLIWQMDEGMFTEHPRFIPFPWKEYLLAAFIAPIALLFLFGIVIQGFEMLGQEAPEATAGAAREEGAAVWGGCATSWASWPLWWSWWSPFRGTAFSLVAAAIKLIGLGGSYGLIALLALALLYLPLRLWLRYRLQKQAMEYQYLLTLAERHGVVVVDPKLHPELAAELEEKKNLAARPSLCSPAPIFRKTPTPINRTCEIFPLQPVPFWGMN